MWGESMRRYTGMDWSYLRGANKRVSNIALRRKPVEGVGDQKNDRGEVRGEGEQKTLSIKPKKRS